jgi:hypothetical protein
MKLNTKVLRDLTDKLISAEDNPWVFDNRFLNNFTGNKRIKKKKAKQFIMWTITNVIVPYVKR